MAEPESTPCAVCQRVPTLTKTIRRHVGMILLQRFVRFKQPLCREHGIEITKTYQRKTLAEGWWGIVSVFVNIFVVISNIGVLSAYKALPEPGFGPVVPRLPNVGLAPGAVLPPPPPPTASPPAR